MLLYHEIRHLRSTTDPKRPLISTISVCILVCVGILCWSVAANTHADPRVFQSLLSRDSLGWIDSQHLIDEVFGFRGDRVPLWRGELEETWELMGMY